MAFKQWFARLNWAKILNYLAAYLSFIIFMILGIGILFVIRSNIYAIASLIGLHPQIIYLINSWGTFILFIPYVIFVAFLEPYLNKEARKGQAMMGIKKVMLYEGGLGAISLLVAWYLTTLGLPIMM